MIRLLFEQHLHIQFLQLLLSTAARKTDFKVSDVHENRLDFFPLQLNQMWKNIAPKVI